MINSICEKIYKRIDELEYIHWQNIPKENFCKIVQEELKCISRSPQDIIDNVKEVIFGEAPQIPECFNVESSDEKLMPMETLETLVKVSSKVEEFLLQDLQPDAQRLEIEEVARVVITPIGVEVYTYDDKIYFIEIGGTKIKKMKWKDSVEGEGELEEECTKIMTVRQ